MNVDKSRVFISYIKKYILKDISKQKRHLSLSHEYQRQLLFFTTSDLFFLYNVYDGCEIDVMYSHIVNL